MNRGIITISETGAVTIPTTPVWMTQQEIADLFGVFSCHVRKAIRSIYKNKEVSELDTMRYVRQTDGISCDVYSIEMVMAIAFRVCSKESFTFRQFVTGKVSEIAKANPTMLFVSYGRTGNAWDS